MHAYHVDRFYPIITPSSVSINWGTNFGSILFAVFVKNLIITSISLANGWAFVGSVNAHTDEQ